MKERANKLFEDEQYVEATPLYLHILSLEPEEVEWNYKYGACLLYNSNDKTEALRYLKYGVNNIKEDVRAYYFYGRALHLDYQFDAAKGYYLKYQAQRKKDDKRYPVEREINMCDNGKSLLSTFTDIIVTSKKQISEESFYDIYSDSKTIGGQILVKRDYQSKIDKRKGHVPIVHYPPEAKMIFYASYGDDESTGKDIYMRRKLPNGKWGDAQLAPGGVNSVEDEEYPFMHSSGKFLYYSSKGHNSMGGFDVFMCRYDAENNSFGPPENIDFAISSPDDDLFYVVDEAFENAYFASDRSSESGKLHVYKVKVARVPLQEVIVMGEFVSEINPDDQKISIQLTKQSSNENLETMRADASKGGRYSYVFPQGGKYTYTIEVDGTGDQFKFTVDLPHLDELRPLKQQIVHTMEDGVEVIKLVNKFDENVEGGESLVAQVIRKKSKLDVNVNDINLDEISAEQERAEMLATLGFEGMSIAEVADQLEELSEAAASNKETKERINSNISSELVAKVDRVKELDQMEQELRENAAKVTDPIAKHKLLQEASQKQREKELLISQINGLETLLTEVENLPGDGNTEQLNRIQSEFSDLVTAEKESEALKFLTTEVETLESARSSSPDGIRESYVKESIEIRNRIRTLRENEDEYKRLVNTNEARINTLKREREGAKKKDLERIDAEISSLEGENKMAEDQIESVAAQISDLERKLNKKEEQLASLQNAMSTLEASDVTIADALEASSEVEEIENVEPYDYQAEMTQLEEEHPEINGGEPVAEWSTEIADAYETAVNAINNDPALTELEQVSRTIDQNQEALQSIDSRLNYIDQQPSNPKLEAQETALLEQKNALEEDLGNLQEREKVLKAETPDAALSKEDVLVEIAPGFEENLQTILGGSESREEQLQQELELRQELDKTINEQISETNTVLDANPQDEEAAARRELLTQLKEENEALTEGVQDALSQNASNVVLSPEEMINEIAEGYQSSLEEIANSISEPLEREEATLDLNEEARAKLDKEEARIDKQLKKSPEDQELVDRKKAVNEAQAVLDAKIAEGSQTIAALNGSSTVVNVSPEDVVNEVLPDYEAQNQSIEQGGGSPLEKEQQRVALEEQLQKSLAKEAKQLEKKLRKDSSDLEAKARLDAVDKAVEASNERKAIAENQILALENVDPPVATLSREQVLQDIAPDYNKDLQAVSENEGSKLEQEQAVKAIHEALATRLEEALETVQQTLENDPENAEALQKKTVLEELRSETETKITAADVRIQELEEGGDLAQQETDFINAVRASVGPEVENALTAELNTKEALEEQDGTLAAYEAELEERISAQEELVSTDPTEANQNQLDWLREELEEVQKKRRAVKVSIGALEQDSTPAPSDESTFIAEVREAAGDNIETALNTTNSSREDLEAQETVLSNYEAALEERIDAQEQRVTEDPSEANQDELNWLVAESERVQSKKRAVKVSIGELEQDGNSLEQEKTAFITSVRESIDGPVENALTTTSTSKEDLETQDAVLAAYEAELENRIEVSQKTLDSDPSIENQKLHNWLVEELERARKKRRAVKISIGELEQVAVATNADPEVQRLIAEEAEIKNALEDENLSNSERKQLNKELSEVTEERYEKENTVLTEKGEQQKEETEVLQNNLAEISETNEGAVSSRVLEHVDREEELIEALEVDAKNAKSEAERNYLLNQAQQRRDQLNDEIEEAVVDAKLEAVEERFEIETASETELERKKRRYTIQIGEVSRDIERVDQELSEAKRNDIEPLESERTELVARKAKLQAQLERVDNQLAKVEHTQDAVNREALEEAVTFNEEREIAASDEYAAYQENAIKALSLGNEISTLENELSAKRLQLQRMVRNGEPDESVELQAREIKELEEKIDSKRVELVQRKYTADQTLPDDEEKAMKMQNLVARGIQPLKLTVAAAALIQMPTTGFAIDTSSSRPNNGITEIPIGVAHPEGLVYRVQVGAFARPLRDDVFREFNPVSGEKIEGTNITRYMAGYFNSSETVVNAREEIRSLGYSDAFVIAYCNGERITLGEARRREAAGICVPKREEEILIEVAENTAETLNLPVTEELKVVPEWTYNQAPGAVDADPIEKMEGLFFTVQVGVFNRPVSDEELNNMPNVSTFRLPNGQIRYNSGMFDSAEEAIPRQNFARTNGIRGAFITAYYKGERISIANARRLLMEYGGSILQSQMDAAPEPNQPTDVVRTDTVTTNAIELVAMEEWELRVQVVSEKTFDEFPRDVLNRYNAEGAFYYDVKDKKVKSIIYKNEEYLPNLRNFADDIDTIYLEEGLLEDQSTDLLEVVFTDSLIPGDFMDWMLRCSYRREMQTAYNGTIVRIYGVPEEEMEGTIERIRVFGVEPNRIAEKEEDE